jgi:putative transposase
MADIRHKAIRYRIYPTESQRILIGKTIGCARFVYNRMLALSKEAYLHGEKLSSRNALNYRLTDLKREFEWLNEVDSTALTAANDGLADAFSGFFAHRTGFPNFHKKHAAGSYTSKRIKRSNNIAVGSRYIKLPKVGLVKAKIHKRAEDGWMIKSATVSRESDGRYYVSVLYEFEQSIAQVPVSDNAIGLDYKSDGLYMDSNGNVGSQHKYYRESQEKLKRAQCRLSRKVGSEKGVPKSKNWLKQQNKVNRIHTKIANQRKDTLHKLSTEIANQYDVVCVEDINMRDLSNEGFGNGKATMDNGYGMFVNMLDYKLADRGKHLVKVDKWYPSSQLCSSCGIQQPRMKNLSIRTFVCPCCGKMINRDLNAAINIKCEGLRILAERQAV